jgi:hypothetical protein
MKTDAEQLIPLDRLPYIVGEHLTIRPQHSSGLFVQRIFGIRFLFDKKKMILKAREEAVAKAEASRD